MNLNHATNKQTGSELSATEWNALASDVNELGAGGGGANNVTISDDTVTDPSAGVSIVTGVSQVGTAKVIELTKKKKGVNTTIVSGNNINFEPRESVDTTKGGNISFKPGDDIEFCSHHRVANSQDEVSMKIINGDDVPVKLLLNAASMTLTTKDKTGDNANVFDINVNSGKNTKGYLKVRAQAIDLRCEDHGGISILPKGQDGQGHMNKIKFEHGGGDGLEFGTFNTEHTSLFTEDYRFNKNGILRLATRTTVASDKADANDPTTAYKYVKAADDFYDNIDQNDPTCTWEDLITFVKWAKDNFEGPFTISRYINKQILNNKNPNTGRIIINFPAGKSPRTVLEFINNIVSVKADNPNVDHAPQGQIYTLSATQESQPNSIGFVGTVETEMYGQNLQDTVSVLTTLSFAFVNAPNNSPGFAVVTQLDSNWNILEIEYSENNN